MRTSKLLWLLPLLILASCSEGDVNFESKGATGSSPAVAAEEVNDPAPIKSVPAALTSPDRKMIRTVDFHCKVPDVLNAVTVLEKQVKAVGGVIEESHVDNNSIDVKTIAYKPDSLKQVQVYHTTAMLTLRVPAAMLDSVVGIIPSVSGFVESRRLSQQDVTLKYLSNQMLNKPDEAPQKSARALQLAADSREVIEVQRNEDARKERMVSRQIENLKLIDNVAYSTLTVGFSQPDQTLVQIVVNPDYVMKVPFSTQCSMAAQGGLDLISGIIIGLLTIWPVLLVIMTGLITGFVVMRQRRKLYQYHKQ